MAETRYTKDHEWVRLDGDVGTCGITKFAAEQLGDVVFVELPDNGRAFSTGDEAAVIESVKAAAELYAPLDGEIVEGNQAVVDNPAGVNEDPEGEGWFFRLKIADKAQFDALMSADDYAKFVEELDD
ncbi:MAG: glycine cleavage system protein GcvH [Alphaproteobacteria bacterium]